MAKASAGKVDVETIRTMLTAGERKVFNSSIGKEITAAGREQLQAAIGQARTLRDKWRDLYAQQTRTTKRTPKAGTVANDRSREKSEAFAGAVARLEARLAELGTAAEPAVRSAKVSTRAPSSKALKRATPKKVRTAVHRATRAGVKSELKRSTTAAGPKKPKQKQKAKR